MKYETFLGLPVGSDYRRLNFWDPVVNHIKFRLSSWKSKYLSFGGRLVLLKSILTSLPFYALSFFKARIYHLFYRISFNSIFFLGSGVRIIEKFLGLLGLHLFGEGGWWFGGKEN